MITDAQTRLFNATAITSATTYTSNAYDTLSTNTPANNLGGGRPPRLKVTADVAFAGGTNITLNLVQSANSDLSSATTLASKVVTGSPAIGASLWDIPIPDTTARYIGMTAVSTGTYTAGTLSANMVSDTDRNPYYTANTGL